MCTACSWYDVMHGDGGTCTFWKSCSSPNISLSISTSHGTMYIVNFIFSYVSFTKGVLETLKTISSPWICNKKQVGCSLKSEWFDEWSCIGDWSNLHCENLNSQSTNKVVYWNWYGTSNRNTKWVWDAGHAHAVLSVWLRNLKNIR